MYFKTEIVNQTAHSGWENSNEFNVSLLHVISSSCIFKNANNLTLGIKEFERNIKKTE